MQMEYPISDLARIFPDMPPEDFARLVRQHTRGRADGPYRQIACHRTRSMGADARNQSPVHTADIHFPLVPGTGLYPSFPTPTSRTEC